MPPPPHPCQDVCCGGDAGMVYFISLQRSGDVVVCERPLGTLRYAPSLGAGTSIHIELVNVGDSEMEARTEDKTEKNKHLGYLMRAN